MVDIDVRVGVRQLFCYHGADEEDSEPYLWVIGFKLDGSTVKQNLTRLTWTPDFFFSGGSHGNLGRVAKPGSKISIPRNVGTWETTVKPITLVDAQLNATEAPGAVGFIAVLLEENNVPDHAAEAGHQALNTFVAQSFSDFVTGIDLLDVNAKVAQRVAGGASKEQALEDEIKVALHRAADHDQERGVGCGVDGDATGDGLRSHRADLGGDRQRRADGQRLPDHDDARAELHP